MSQAYGLAVVDHCTAILSAPLPKRGPHSRNINIATVQGSDAMGSAWGRPMHGHRMLLGRHHLSSHPHTQPFQSASEIMKPVSGTCQDTCGMSITARRCTFTRRSLPLPPFTPVPGQASRAARNSPSKLSLRTTCLARRSSQERCVTPRSKEISFRLR